MSYNIIIVSIGILFGSFICSYLIHLYKSYENINWEIFQISKEDFNNDKYLFSDSDVKVKNYNNNKKINNEIVIGIDFGTVFSGYSYNMQNDATTIKSMKKKFSDIILSKGKQNGLIYSDKAHISIMNFNQKELSKILYLKDIKSIISSKNNTINDNLCYYYPKDITLNIKNDIKAYFTMMKKEILNDLNNIKEINPEQILWVIAIPSNWDEFQKQLIYKSLKDSDMSNIKMIFESEAAALSVFNDKNIDIKNKKLKNYFLLIDIGGSSASISINKINDKDGNINQISNLVLNDIGYIYIIEEIINIFIYLIGEEKVNKIKSTEPGAWIKFLEEINYAIENTYNINGIEIFEIRNIFDCENDKKFKLGDNIYNLKCNKYFVDLPSKLVGNIILNNINKINAYLDEIILFAKNNKININSFILTGGFSTNKIIKNEINNYVKEKSIQLQYMSSHDYVISKGCVLYGINPKNIIKPKSPITLGIYNLIKGEMEILIKKGDEIKGEINFVKYIKPQLEKQKYIQIFIYITGKNILDNRELKNYLFGRYLITTDKNIKIIELKIKYENFLTFSAFNYENGEEISGTEFQFFNREQVKRFSNIIK